MTESERFAPMVQAHNQQVTFVRVRKGGHYESMIQEGIPRAITWLQGLTAR